MTGLVVNASIGSSIFATPGELSRLLGAASPLAVILAAVGLGVIMAAIIEVASQFRDAGGAYVYVRTAFGRFLGIQVGWFWLLSLLGGGAAAANVFVTYLAGFVPEVSHGLGRAACITVVVAVPTIANCLGVKQGANLCNLFTVAKILPLTLIVGLGLLRFRDHFQMIHRHEITSPGWNAWLTALLLLLAAMGGAEDTLAPTGEVHDPRRTIPFGVAMGLIACVPLYVLVQFVTVATNAAVATDHPLVEAANILLGPAGTGFISIAVLFSTYGMLAAAIMNAPRVSYAFSAHNDFPISLGRLHTRYHTPARAIGLFAIALWVLAISGSFLWLIVVTGGSMAIEYIGMCAALIRMRKLRPNADALRVPCGNFLAAFGIVICFALLTRLQRYELLLMGIVGLVAGSNWWWARRQAKKINPEQTEVVAA